MTVCKGVTEMELGSEVSAEVSVQRDQGCLTCQKINKKGIRQAPAGGRRAAYQPLDKIQVDFTELPKAG